MPTNLDGHSSHDVEDTHNAQPGFVGNLAMALLVLAVLFAIVVMIAALTHPAAS